MVSAQAGSGIKAADTLTARKDTVISIKNQGSTSDLKSKVTYTARDSMAFDLTGQKVFLYGAAQINYEDIVLKAERIIIDFSKKIVTAYGITDSAGKETGTPEFSEGGHDFKSKRLEYNFDTRKGIITGVITQEGDGFLHGRVIKKMSDNIINIGTGKYTTCNLEHPHYEFRFTKSKVIPDNKIVTGPAYLTIADVPTPLAIPFGLFPNKKGQRSGILLPTYGESYNRGFYFENFGYYWGFSQYADLELRGDIYTLGSWAFRTTSRYNKRYRFNGAVNFGYTFNKLGIPGSPDYQNYRDYSIRWSHAQSDKARPNSRFSANVNIVSNRFNQFNPANTNAYLSNTFQSSVSYQKNWSGKYFLTASLNHSQNTIQRTVNMTLPDFSFSVNRFSPFARKTRTGPARWYENISVNYQTTAQNSISTYDSLLFKPGFGSRFRNGMQHSVTIGSPLKVMKYFILNNSVGYKERWYTSRISRAFVIDTANSPGDTLARRLRTDTLEGFFSNRDINFSSSLSTTLYGLIQFKKGVLRGVRHVINPSVTFSYVPGFREQHFGVYDYYTDTTGKEVRYSMFENGIYGYPPAETSGRIGFNISNNIEIKVRSEKDTVTGTRKIPLVENFSISASYDLSRDSLRWSTVGMSGRTRLFRNIDISYSSTWDPYVLDSTGLRNLNQFEWEKNGRFLRMTNTGWGLSLNWALNSSKIKGGDKNTSTASTPEIPAVPGTEEYVDFNIPWSFNLSYSFRYGTNITYAGFERQKTNTVIQTLNFSGDINITQRWKIGFRSGYDFEAGELSYTSVDFYRDLHCWEMRFGWVPTGFRKSWNFTINVKSALLQDLKLNKKKDFRDL